MSFPALVWIANLYMSLYQQARVDIRKERAIADRVDNENEEDTTVNKKGHRKLDGRALGA